MLHVQTCQYAELAAWNRVAQEHGIERWSIQAGSLVGFKCYGSMNPWDDDIDLMMVSPPPMHPCKQIDDLYDSLEQISGGGWAFRSIGNGAMLLKRRGKHKYKVKMIQDTYNKADIGGLDIDCLGRTNAFEEDIFERSGAAKLLRNTSIPLQTVQFGPVTTQVFPDATIDKYLQTRKWHCLG